jgi:hypothetical protein
MDKRTESRQRSCRRSDLPTSSQLPIKTWGLVCVVLYHPIQGGVPSTRGVLVEGRIFFLRIYKCICGVPVNWTLPLVIANPLFAAFTRSLSIQKYHPCLGVTNIYTFFTIAVAEF